MMEIKYLGHSAFEITTKEYKILVDPFLICSPNYKAENITDIFVSHAHSDHLGSAIEISKTTGAQITGVFELTNYCAQRGANVVSTNLGAWLEYAWGKVRLVPAFHSSSFADGSYGGCPCGFIFEIENQIIYHAGDTCLSQEMKTIGEIYKPNVAILPIGGTYTMDIEQATLASKWLNASQIIPMHYNTFEAIKVNLKHFEDSISEIGATPIILKIEETRKL